LNKLLRIALLVLCLTASTTQSWVTQLHFHGKPAAVASTPGLPGHPEGQCLLCQVAAQGVGVPFVAATTTLVAAPRAFIRLPASVQPTGDSDSRSHHWSSRGPPRV
jgi:hypothetical protein